MSRLALLVAVLLAACVPTEPEPVRSVTGWWSGTVEAPVGPAALTLNLHEAPDGSVEGFATLNWWGDDIAYPLQVTGTNADASVTLRAFWAFGVRSVDWTLALTFEGPDRLIGSVGTWPVAFERLPR